MLTGSGFLPTKCGKKGAKYGRKIDFGSHQATAGNVSGPDRKQISCRAFEIYH